MRYLLKYSRYLMLLGGKWQRPYFRRQTAQTIYKIYSHALQIIYSVLCGSMVSKFFSILIEGNIEKLSDSIVITCVLSGIKSIIYQYGGFLDLFEIMLDEEQKILAIDDSGLTKIYTGFANYIYVTSRLICIYSCTTGMCLVCLQCLHGFLGDYTDSEKPMIIMAYFPFDQQVHYKTALLIQTIFLAIAAVYYCLTQVTYITAVTYVKMELKLLQYQFREFDRFKMIYNIVDDEVMMIKLIRRHQFIIGFTAEVNKLLRPILLVEFLLSSVNISFVVLQLISSETNMPLPFTLNYFVILIAQLLILAWHANEISIESLGISSAVWEQPWYEKSVKIQKMMYMVVCRSHKPLTLTIGPFGNLTTQTVINVINAAYSYVTIMRHNDS